MSIQYIDNCIRRRRAYDDPRPQWSATVTCSD